MQASWWCLGTYWLIAHWWLIIQILDTYVVIRDPRWNILVPYIKIGRWGARIVKWSLHLTFEHRYATPWAVSKHNIYTYFIISIWFIWSDTTLFVCQICHWIVKQKKENKRNIFYKKYHSTVRYILTYERLFNHHYLVLFFVIR